MSVKIGPSMLCADFRRLGQQLRELEDAGADFLHFDVMDGHFVPNLTFGAPLLAGIRPESSLPFDAHLMVYHPDCLIEPMAQAGANIITVHVETAVHLHRVIHQIRELGLSPWAALNPATPPGALAEVLDQLDGVLVMSVNPGFAGQEFIPFSVRKVAELRRMAGDLPLEIGVDGGVSEENIAELTEAGATCFVVGNRLFNGDGSLRETISRLKEAAAR